MLLMPEFNLQHVAQTLGARLDAKDSAHASLKIFGVSGIEEAGPGQITFIANPKYAVLARTTKASAVLVPDDFASLPTETTAALRTKNPHLAFAKAIELFQSPPKYAPRVHPSAVIHASAKLGKNCHIGACAVVGNVVLGDDCVVLPHAVLYD